MVQEAPALMPLNECGVLIAGGTSGVGLTTAMKFAEVGVTRMALLGRNEERGKKAQAAVRARFPLAQVEFVAADAIDPVQAKQAGEEAERLIGSVDILLNSICSRAVPGLFHESPIEEILPTVVDLLMAPLNMCSAVLPGMRSRGRGVIINIASDAAKVPTPGEAVIGAAMAAIVRFSTTLALEAKRFGVRVNTVTPSLIVGTEVYEKIMANEFAGKLFKKAASAAHLGLTRPEDIAHLIVFLASPEASLITGQVISVNGGISAV
jgi:NAD(P)-dependent dehydrogenase (short-subunit alcohol dehydrogenase family)